MLFDEVRQDIQAVRDRDPAARGSLETLLVSSGLHAILLHRPAHWLYRKGAYLPARMLSQFAKFLTGIEIHPGAKIGKGVLIDHGMGVVIGETAEVGNYCTIYQGVTLGGTGKDKGKRHPTLGDHVTVGCGAKILGPFRVEDGCKVAANAVVLSPLPAKSTAVGVPARVVRVSGRRPEELDHIHTPDPVAQQMCRLEFELHRLKERVAELEKEQITAEKKERKDVHENL